MLTRDQAEAAAEAVLLPFEAERRARRRQRRIARLRRGRQVRVARWGFAGGLVGALAGSVLLDDWFVPAAVGYGAASLVAQFLYGKPPPRGRPSSLLLHQSR